MKRQQVVIHDFYCIKCGQKGISLPRKRGELHGANHLKKMYCPHCQTVVNHVECKNEFDAYQFKEDFLAGKYLEEAQKPLPDEEPW